MKGKLTLSLDKKYIAKLRKASLRRKKSITALVEEFADRLDPEEGDGKGTRYLADELKGILTGKISASDVKSDPRLAHILGEGQ